MVILLTCAPLLVESCIPPMDRRYARLHLSTDDPRCMATSIAQEIER